MARSENIVTNTSENGPDRELHKLMFYVTGDQSVRYSEFARDVLTTVRSLADQEEMSGAKCTLTQVA